MKRIIAVATILLLAATLHAAEGRKPYTRNVAVFLYDNAEILDFSGPLEVLSAAGGFGQVGEDRAFNVFTVAATKEPIHAQGIVTIVPQYSIADAPKIDVLVIPGGNTAPTIDDAAAMAWIRKTVENDEVTLTVCTGASPLAKLGLLDGLEVTTWYGAIERVQALAPKAKFTDGRRYIDNGRIITTAGVSAGIDGALHLTARLLGRRVADRTAEYMEYHWTPEPYLAKSYAYFNPSTDAHGRELARAEMQRHEKDFAGAIATAVALTKTDPHDADAWLALGDTYEAAGDYGHAIDAYAHIHAPGYQRTALVRTARTYARQDKKSEALAYIAKATAAGFTDTARLASDPAFRSIRDALVAK